MRLHKEGIVTLVVVFLALTLIVWIIYTFVPLLFEISVLVALLFYLFILQFFRNPKRAIPQRDNSLIYAPADGKVVVIETTHEPEYFQEERRQISIFMSPLNVHVNRNPISGTVRYSRYHPGKFLVAWHPKSSTENERTTVVIGAEKGDILLRQIAGAVARRIKNYLKEGQSVQQGAEMGFIKFGSRVDVFLPLDAEVLVQPDQVVKGNVTVIARW
ncbi:MAG TPA: phosphatidylserine decarboxylase family protein [Saprospiraceae bacterium]|nr:phosphatidylserine decarboxylase family protein [Saprospiraceae bacterium]HMQ83172.1 phosphatidylserine decarboxylase family protein [Saprospiraceae bacterium]